MRPIFLNTRSFNQQSFNYRGNLRETIIVLDFKRAFTFDKELCVLCFCKAGRTTSRVNSEINKTASRRKFTPRLLRPLSTDGPAPDKAPASVGRKMSGTDNSCRAMKKHTGCGKQHCVVFRVFHALSVTWTIFTPPSQ